MSEHPVAVYGSPFGWEPPTTKEHHKEGYIEWTVPKKIEKKIDALIKKEIKKFYSFCKCGECKKWRKRRGIK